MEINKIQGPLHFIDINTYINKDVSNNLTFTDIITGTKTLAELLAGITTFAALTDTPVSYSGQAGSVPSVNIGETGLEYDTYLKNYTTLGGTFSWNTVTGKAEFISSALDGPLGTTKVDGISIPHGVSTEYTLQVGGRRDTSPGVWGNGHHLFFRHQENSTWYDWEEIWHTGNNPFKLENFDLDKYIGFGIDGAGSNLITNANLGIGITGPKESLAIGSSTLNLPAISGTSTNGLLRVGYNDYAWGGGELAFGVSSSSSYNYAGWLQTSNPLDKSVSRNLLLNPNGGNVGIGTTSPLYPLSIRSSGAISNQLDLGDEEGVMSLGGNNLGQMGISSGRLVNSTYSTTHATKIVGASGNLKFYTIDGVTSGTVYNPTVRMTILANGNVGVNDITPSEKLEINGNAKATDFLLASDRRLKKNIKPLDTLEKILQLEVVSFEWRENKINKGKGRKGKDFGLIAQDVEKIIPEIVSTGSDDYKSIGYSRLGVLAIDGVKELHYKMLKQAEEITELKRLVNKLISK